MSPGAGRGISLSNPPLIPRPGLRLEMAGAEPGSSGTPARRARLPLASPALPRDCDPGGLAPPAEGWGPRAPGTPAPARLREAVPTQVRPGGVGKGRDTVCQKSRAPHVLSGCSPSSLVSAGERWGARLTSGPPGLGRWMLAGPLGWGGHSSTEP